MAKEEVEVQVPVQAEGIAEVSTLDRDNEIVYLYCTLKDPNRSKDNNGKPFQTEVCRAGAHAFFMGAGQVAKMKRADAEWHVAKTSSFDAIHFHLKLEVKTETEMAAIKAALEARAKAKASASEEVSKSNRARLEAQALEAGVKKEDIAPLSDADLAALVAG